MEQYYFEANDSEICYTKDHFNMIMVEDGLTEMEVFTAEPERIAGVFWCTMHSFCADDSRDTCGKQCEQYEPRNGKNGRCRFHCERLYTHGSKITLNNAKPVFNKEI